MNQRVKRATIGLAVAALGLGGVVGAEAGVARTGASPTFNDPTSIDNPYLPLTKHRRCVLKGKEDGARHKGIVRLLRRTEPFPYEGGTVETAVFKHSEYEDGELVEITLDYFAQADDGTVYYFGEDVDDYENGKVVGHGGAWRYGQETDKLGVGMPARPRVGDRWRHENVPGVTTEDDKVVDRLNRKRINGRVYRKLIRVRELQRPGRDVEFKLYARGVGIVQELPPDGRVQLIDCDR